MQRDFVLDPADTERLANLAGPFDQHLRQIELRLGVEIANRGNVFRVSGSDADAVARTERLLRELYADAADETLDEHAVHLRLGAFAADEPAQSSSDYVPQDVSVRVKRGTLRGRGDNQRKYLHAIATHDINFGIGPAGTGKTYLAVAMAVDALNQSRVQRVILVRPAVEAGEKLGFLPGDLSQKIDPYLRPLYDALYEMLGFEHVAKLIERNVIEVAPLAYMRGRTLNNSFIILDESQNTTVEQMKMFLTRIGFGSTAVITGDVTQVDLPKSRSPACATRWRCCAASTASASPSSRPRTWCGIRWWRASSAPKGIPAAVSFRKWVAAALAGRIREADLAIRLVDAKEGRALNRHYRGRDYATNVLSFPAELPEGLPEGVRLPLLGDLVICAPVVAREALEQRKPLAAHYAHLTVHGTLHLLGWDHEDDREADAMEQLEREILAGLGLPDPYRDGA